MRSRRIAVGVSGSGRSLRNFLEQQREGVGYEVAGVIASRPDCKAVDIARAADLPIFCETFSAKTLAAVGPKLYDWLESRDIGWIALAGFLKLFPVDPRWVGRIVNIHPALLPKHGGHGMYGDRVHEAVVAARDTTTGATVHFVNERYDEGRIVAQIEVIVKPSDTVHDVADRVFAAECKLYPDVMSRLIDGTLPRRDGTIERLVHVP